MSDLSDDKNPEILVVIMMHCPCVVGREGAQFEKKPN